MPPRGDRKSSGGAPRASEPTSPASKRKTNDTAEVESSPRRSKRVKSTNEPKAVSTGSAKANGTVKEEAEEETKDGTDAVADVSDEKPAPVEKGTKKRKTKQEKEAENMPLRARTPGLRMLVGAHVSAAKGMSQCMAPQLGQDLIKCIAGVFNSITNSAHIG